MQITAITAKGMMKSWGVSAGTAVASTVASRFCRNRADAMISGTITVRRGRMVWRSLYIIATPLSPIGWS